MGTYNSAVITNGGQSMIAQAVVGASLEFTTIKTSSYAYPAGTNLATLTTISGIKQSKDITSATVYNSRIIKISAAVDNTGISTAYTINTIGIYAKVGSSAESLFAVVTASAADTMPAYDSKPYSYIYEISLTMQNAANVTVTVNAAGLVNVTDLNAAKVEIQGEIADLKSDLRLSKTYINEHFDLSETPLYDGYDHSVFIDKRNLSFGYINGSDGAIQSYTTIRYSEFIPITKATDAVRIEMDLTTYKVAICMYKGSTWVHNTDWYASALSNPIIPLKNISYDFDRIRIQYGRKAERTLTEADDVLFVNLVNVRVGSNDFMSIKTDTIKYYNAIADISSASNKLLARINDNVILNGSPDYFTDTPTGRGGAFINIRYTSGYNEQFFFENATGDRYERVIKRDDHSIYRDWTAIITKAKVDELDANQIRFVLAVAPISEASNRILANINDNVIFNATAAYFDDTPRGYDGSFLNIRYTSGYNEQIFIESGSGNRYERVVSRSGTIYRDWTLNSTGGTRFLSKKVYCTGDSIMWGRTDADGRASLTIPNNIASRYPVSVVNSAVGGDCIAHRTDGASVYDRITQVDLSSYDYVVINGGTNDYGFGVLLGTADSVDVSTFYGAYKAIITYILEQNPYMRIMLITPIFRNYVAQGRQWHYGNSYEMVGDGGYTMDEMCDAIVAIGKKYNIPVFDSRKNSPINELNYETTLELTSGATDRYLHPSDASYKLYGDSIASFFGNAF